MYACIYFKDVRTSTVHIHTYTHFHTQTRMQTHTKIYKCIKYSSFRLSMARDPETQIDSKKNSFTFGFVFKQNNSSKTSRNCSSSESETLSNSVLSCAASSIHACKHEATGCLVSFCWFNPVGEFSSMRGERLKLELISQ